MKKRVKSLILLAIIIIIIIIIIFPLIQASFSEDLHLNIKVVNDTGDALNGTFEFQFDITNTTNCSSPLYTNTTNLTTNSQGEASYYLRNININNYDQNLYLCYYRNGTLRFNNTISPAPQAIYSNSSKSLNTSDGYILDINKTQLENQNGVLNIIDSWINGLFCRLIGCTMLGNINMGLNNITNVSVLNFSNGFIGNVNHIQFNTSEQNIGTAPGMLVWDIDDRTLELGLDSDVTLQLGQEQYFKGINKYGSTMSDGTVVYISGSQGNRPTIVPADATDPDKFWVVGVLTESCANNAECYVATQGVIHNLNTSAWAEGEHLYLDENNPGQLTSTHPANSTSAGIFIALVTNSDTTLGSILVTNPQYFAIGNNYDGQLRYTVINKNNGTSAMSLFTTINDVGHRASFGIVGSNHETFEPEDVSIYNEGYGGSYYLNDGNVSWIWRADPLDRHNYSFQSYNQMQLTPEGNLNISGNFDVPNGSINVSGNITASYFISNTNIGLTGNYTNGNCWTAYSGGIMHATNCTAI